MNTSKYSICISTVIIFAFSFSLFGKTLFVLQHNDSDNLKVFHIQGNTLSFQEQITLPEHGLGPIDIEVDNVNDVLFISYEAGSPGTGGIIEMYGATTLNYLGSRNLYSTLDITGLAYDPAREYLYFTNRSDSGSTSGLFVYAWNPQTRTLTHVASNGLTNLYATGLALNVSPNSCENPYLPR